MRFISFGHEISHTQESERESADVSMRTLQSRNHVIFALIYLLDTLVCLAVYISGQVFFNRRPNLAVEFELFSV